MTFDGVDEPQFGQTNDRFTLGAFSNWIQVRGGVFDGPALEFHQEADRIGPCRLLTYNGAAFCDPPCDYVTETCFDGSCVSLPQPLSVGSLELGGVDAASISIPAEANGVYDWFSQDYDVSQLTDVSLSAAGDQAPGFSLSACVVPPPEPEGDWVQLLEQRQAGADVVLTWSNPVASARIYLRMTTGIGTHGGISPVEIECEGRDTGTLTLPGAFLDELYSVGWSCGECGGNDLWRYHATETGAGNHTVQLRTQSVASFWYIP